MLLFLLVLLLIYLLGRHKLASLSASTHRSLLADKFLAFPVGLADWRTGGLLALWIILVHYLNGRLTTGHTLEFVCYNLKLSTMAWLVTWVHLELEAVAEAEPGAEAKSWPTAAAALLRIVKVRVGFVRNCCWHPSGVSGVCVCVCVYHAAYA